MIVVWQGELLLFLNAFNNDGQPLGAIEIISQLAWGLGYCGMPHILVRFMAVRDEKELKKIQSDCYCMGCYFSGNGCCYWYCWTCFSVPDYLG